MLLPSSSPNRFCSHKKRCGLAWLHSASLSGSLISSSLLITLLRLVKGIRKSHLQIKPAVRTKSSGISCETCKAAAVSLEQSQAETFPWEFPLTSFCRELFALDLEMYQFGGNSFNNCQIFPAALWCVLPEHSFSNPYTKAEPNVCLCKTARAICSLCFLHDL